MRSAASPILTLVLAAACGPSGGGQRTPQDPSAAITAPGSEEGGAPTASATVADPVAAAPGDPTKSREQLLTELPAVGDGGRTVAYLEGRPSMPRERVVIRGVDDSDGLETLTLSEVEGRASLTAKLAARGFRPLTALEPQLRRARGSGDELPAWFQSPGLKVTQYGSRLVAWTEADGHRELARLDLPAADDSPDVALLGRRLMLEQAHVFPDGERLLVQGVPCGSEHCDEASSEHRIVAIRGTAIEALGTFPLSCAVAQRDGHPVVDRAWIDERVWWANTIFASQGVSFELVKTRPLRTRSALEDRDDRHALGADMEVEVINCFVVASLRDVDDPSRMRMGVHWRPDGLPGAHFVIISASAAPAVLAHELGHFFGNRVHPDVPGNIMSYRRGRAMPFFDDEQGRRITRFARRFVRSGELRLVRPPRRSPEAPR